MKKCLFVSIIILLPFLINAQEDELVIKGTKKITEKMTPQQVVDSLNKRFPNAKAVQYYQIPADSAKRGWAISEEDNLDPSAEVDYYTISFKQEGLKYYGLYDKDGKLLQCKIEESVDKLPDPVRNTLMNISTQYPGFKVTSKTYFRNQNYSKSKEYYEVVAKRGDETKKLYLTPDGKIIKEK